jgi:hypothetical protein
MFNKNNQQKQEKPVGFFTKYLGGHIRFPTNEGCMVWVYSNKVVIDLMKSKHQFNIPYSSMVDLKNADGGNKLDGKRAVALGLVFVPLGVVSLIWKKHHVLTMIEYKDENNENRTIVLDFEDNTRNVQPVIYDRMVAARTKAVELILEPTLIQKEHLGGPFN